MRRITQGKNLSICSIKFAEKIKDGINLLGVTHPRKQDPSLF